MLNRKKSIPIETLISKFATVNGDVVFEGGLRVDGRVKGNLIAVEGKPSMLVISEDASVEGSIRVAHLIVMGSVVGPAHATELLEIQPTARMAGNVTYTTLEMFPGAIVDGLLRHQTEASQVPNLKLAASNQ